MDLVAIYGCLCDRTRLRILHLLLRGPLCVCQLQAALREPQVKVSKHLAYLRRRGLVVGRRGGNWMIYALPPRPTRELAANLACLQDCSAEEPVFRRDRRRLERIGASLPESLARDCLRPARRNPGSRRTTPASP